MELFRSKISIDLLLNFTQIQPTHAIRHFEISFSISLKINILEEQFHSASENEGDKYGDENQDPNTTLDKGPIAKQECSFHFFR